MLTPFDDYPLHQTSRPFAHVAGGLNQYDRFFFNGYTSDTSLYFAAAMGLYPNRAVIDGAFSVVHAGEQRSVFASGRCPVDRTQTAVGPLRVVIVEPLRVLRVVVDTPDQGVQVDLRFEARTAPIEEPRFTWSGDEREAFDYTRLTQFGAWDGVITVDGRDHPLTASTTWGSRDRSWGVRPVGDRIAGPPVLTQFYWLWAPVSFDDLCAHFDVQEDGRGRRWHDSAFVVPVDARAAAEPEPMAGVRYRLDWEPGTRRARRAEIELLAFDGESRLVTLEGQLHFQMAGLGYTHPEWRHGMWKGELAVAADRWSVPVAEPLAPQNWHVQTLCTATLGDRHGIGILEQLVVGPHTPTGLREWFDGVPSPG
jgi:hypothetical protein